MVHLSSVPLVDSDWTYTETLILIQAALSVLLFIITTRPAKMEREGESRREDNSHKLQMSIR